MDSHERSHTLSVLRAFCDRLKEVMRSLRHLNSLKSVWCGAPLLHLTASLVIVGTSCNMRNVLPLSVIYSLNLPPVSHICDTLYSLHADDRVPPISYHKQRNNPSASFVCSLVKMRSFKWLLKCHFKPPRQDETDAPSVRYPPSFFP